MFLLLGCLTSQAEYDALLARAQDADQDGMAALEHGGTDCDDSDPLVNPLAEELCDGVDNDCNGLVDDAPVDPLVWYLDGDGDGFGDDGRTAEGCEAPAAHVGVGGDCDDTEPLTRPDGYEVCDGVDNDCDGLVDDADDSVDLSTGEAWYPDVDGDGYGDELAVAIAACAAPAGLMLDGSDCDDSDANVNPNATEVCRDGRDNDCSGDAPECALRGEYEISDSDVIFTDTAGSALVLDSDGDGEQEVLIIWTDDDNKYRMTKYEAPFSGDTGRTDRDWEYKTSNSDEVFGIGAATLQDPANAGWDSLLVDVPAAGHTMLFQGSDDGLGDEPTLLISHPVSQAEFGTLVLTAPDEGSSTLIAVGSNDWVDQKPSVFLWNEIPTENIDTESASLTLQHGSSIEFGSTFGGALADFNGDALLDMAVGAGDLDIAYIFNDVESSEGLLGPADATWILGKENGSYFGFSVAAGDVSGDGYDDVLISAPLSDVAETDGGGIYIFHGGSSGISGSKTSASADEQVHGVFENANLGTALKVADVDGNGVDDMLFGSIRNGDGVLFYGPVASRDSEDAADTSFSGITDSNCFWFSELLDINGDESADLLVSCLDGNERSVRIIYGLAI